MFHTKFMIFTGGIFYFFHFINSRKYNIQGIERLMFIFMYISLGVQLYHNFGYMWNVVWNYKHCLKCAVRSLAHSEVNMHHETPTQYMDKHHLQSTISLCITSCYSHLSMIFTNIMEMALL